MPESICYIIIFFCGFSARGLIAWKWHQILNKRFEQYCEVSRLMNKSGEQIMRELRSIINGVS